MLGGFNATPFVRLIFYFFFDRVLIRGIDQLSCGNFFQDSIASCLSLLFRIGLRIFFSLNLVIPQNFGVFYLGGGLLLISGKVGVLYLVFFFLHGG